MPICNRFHERLANNGKITTFRRYRSLMPSCAGFLEPRKSRLGPRNLRSMLKISYATCLCLSHFFRRSSFLKCVSRFEIAKKHENPLNSVAIESQCRAVARRGLGGAQHPYSDFSAPVLREALSTPMHAASTQHPP